MWLYTWRQYVPLQLLLLIFCKSFAPDAFAINYTLARILRFPVREFESVKTIGAVLEKYGMDVTYEFCDLPTAFKASAVKVNNPQRSFGHPL